MATAFDLTGKTILVTGASSGIGRECCVQIARMGGTVLLTARRAELLEGVRAGLPGVGHRCIAGDIWELVTSGRLISSLPQLDGVVHAAGFTKLVPVRAVSGQFMREIAQTNYEAPVLLSQQLLGRRKLRPSASVVFITSIAARIATRGNSVYSGLKGALCSFSRVMALEVASQKIRVNTISPGQVKTPIMASLALISLKAFKAACCVGVALDSDLLPCSNFRSCVRNAANSLPIRCKSGFCGVANLPRA